MQTKLNERKKEAEGGIIIELVQVRKLCFIDRLSFLKPTQSLGTGARDSLSYSTNSKTMDSPWDDDAGFSSEAEWTRISNEFTNVQITPGCTVSY
jgi:hypothetical protein